jgi:tetratricopeptide (TPR) repeat protein
MNTTHAMKNAVMKAAILIVALGFSVAQAEPLHPVKNHSDAQLSGIEKSAVGSIQAGVSSPTVQAKVQTWVKEKISAISSFWTEDPQAVAPQAAPKKSIQASLQAPPSTAKETSRQPAAAVPEKQIVQAQHDEIERVEVVGMHRTPVDVAVYDLATSAKIPRLKIGQEDRMQASQYSLPGDLQKVMNDHVAHPFPSPEQLDADLLKRQLVLTQGPVMSAISTRDAVFSPKGRVSREAFDKLVINLRPELALKLRKFIPLTQDEQRFLSGLLLYQQGDQCESAVGLFHKLSKSPGWVAEASYYLGMCSKQLGLTADLIERSRRVLESQDVYYTKKILKELPTEIPYEQVEQFGAALTKAVSNPKVMDKLEPAVAGNVAFWLTDFGATTGKFKLALDWSKKVPVTHPKRLESEFIGALSEYQMGNKDKALTLQEGLIEKLKGDKGRREFQALVALNVARMYFQESKFAPAHENFLQVYKDHPLWLQSLTELGWSQLMSGDFEGAIGNMYSIQSPFFTSVYKPESYVIRTIGYLKLCQYGDAYRTLTLLEKDYRPILEKIEKFTATNGHSYYQTVRDYLAFSKMAKQPGKEMQKDVDGLPQSVVREMARHRDFINLQKAMNRQIDEREMYSHLDGEVEASLQDAQAAVVLTRKRIMALRRSIGQIAVRHDLEQNRNQWLVELDAEMNRLNAAFFQVDLFTEAKQDMVDYRKEVVGGADQRLAVIKTELESRLSGRVVQMKSDLSRMLDNNELLRFEVFSGSGENIRYQVAGGAKGNRIPAAVIPKSKSLQWDFDGEYWEDEIGHYRSSLKNNCPENSRHQQANLGGAAE